MLFISMEDFEAKARALAPISRQEEIDCARRMQNGDAAARERLIEGYLPLLARYMRRMPVQSIGLVCYRLQALEKAVDSFNFLQDSEPFTHRLNWALRQASTRYTAEHRNPPDGK